MFSHPFSIIFFVCLTGLKAVVKEIGSYLWKCYIGKSNFMLLLMCSCWNPPGQLFASCILMQIIILKKLFILLAVIFFNYMWGFILALKWKIFVTNIIKELITVIFRIGIGRLSCDERIQNFLYICLSVSL